MSTMLSRRLNRLELDHGPCITCNGQGRLSFEIEGIPLTHSDACPRCGRSRRYRIIQAPVPIRGRAVEPVQ